jgi:hypothetical protein
MGISAGWDAALMLSLLSSHVLHIGNADDKKWTLSYFTHELLRLVLHWILLRYSRVTPSCTALDSLTFLTCNPSCTAAYSLTLLTSCTAERKSGTYSYFAERMRWNGEKFIVCVCVCVCVGGGEGGYLLTKTDHISSSKWGTLKLIGRCSGQALGLYSGRARFEHRPGPSIAWKVFRIFSQSLQVTTGIILCQPLPSERFKFMSQSSVLPLDAINADHVLK